MTLVLNVKAELMERLARCMGTRVAPSVDELNASHVGTCREFRVDPLAAHATAVGPGGPALLRGAPASAAAAAAVAAVGPGQARVEGGGLPRPTTGPTGVPSSSSSSLSSLSPAAVPVGAAPAGLPPSASSPQLSSSSSSTTTTTTTTAASAGAALANAPISATRTLMSFGCAVPLGATLLVKGADVGTLARVKRVRSACISWHRTPAPHAMPEPCTCCVAPAPTVHPSRAIVCETAA